MERPTDEAVSLIDEAETPGQNPAERVRLLERSRRLLVEIPDPSKADVVRALAGRLDVEISIDDDPVAAHVLDAGEREALVDDVAGALGVRLGFVEATLRQDVDR